MARHTIRPKSPKRPKSSERARRLIAAALRKYKTERAAARALGLPNHGHLNKIRRGLIYDSTAMKAALLRADKRARRAWLFVPPLENYQIDPDQMRLALDAVGSLRDLLHTMIVNADIERHKSDGHDPTDTPSP